jgi:soluble lytic murein transglycosylase-like protein
MFQSLLFIMLLAFSSLTHAFSVEWIVSHTKGKVPASTAKQIVAAVHKYSFLYEVDPDMIFKIIQNESTYRHTVKAKTSNATGLMQVIPRWHRDKIKGRNLRNIDVNVEVGVRIYKEYLGLARGNPRHALWRYHGGATKKQYAQKILSTKSPPIVMAAYEPPVTLALSHTLCDTRPIECRVKDS